MRKLYALFGGILLLFTNASNARATIPDVANFSFTTDAPNINVSFINTSVTGNEPGIRHYSWSFGDGSGESSTMLQGTQHHYQSAGTYTVCLKIYRFNSNLNDSVLSAQVCKTLTIETSCRAGFEITSATATALGKYFVAQPWNSTNRKPVRICWTFGDGKDTCIKYPIPYSGVFAVYHLYNQAGSYNVCVNIQYDGGCEAQSCHAVQVGEADSCHADFERITVSPSVNPLHVSLKALPSHNHNKQPSRICWTFGDGRDTCIQYANTFTGPYTVNHTYSTNGLYQVCVNILYQGGCEAVKCNPINVVRSDSCSADFERLPVSNTNNLLTVVYKALPWHNNNKKPSRICWTFGDNKDTCINYTGNYTGLYTIEHRYDHSGLYQVCVKILYDGGCESLKCKSMQMGKPDTCHADFERIPTPTATNPLLTYFKALPQHNNNRKPSRVCWTFGDNKDTCINYAENYTGQYAISHTYDHAGLYEVCVTILYFGGCEARKCDHIQVARPDTCQANFERIPVSGTANPLLTYFRALPQHNNNRKPARICWTFGDHKDTCINYTENYTGSYAISHMYDHAALYEVCVTILYFGGCEARKCDHIQVARPDSCQADFERIQETTAPSLNSYFRALPWHNNDKKPGRICWTFGDGKDTCINYGANYTGPYIISHHYLQPGQYEVCVKIVYDGGCESRKCKPVVIAPLQSCTVGLFELAPSVTSITRDFLALPVSSPTGRPERVCLNFGDGMDSCIIVNSQQPLPDFLFHHRYPGPGVYTACVKVWFQGGCIAETCRDVVIHGTTNICGGYMTDSLLGLRAFRFKGFSIQNPNDEAISYRWTFGDGTNALGREVTHVYSQAGDYEVCLTIKTRLGCETRICKTIRVAANNQPALHLSPNPVINVLHAEFLSTHTEQVNISILNSTGSPVRTYVRSAIAGSNNWDFDLGNLLPGVYSFIVQSPNQLASAIFIKQ